MTCKSCQQHREAIKAAVKAASPVDAIKTTVRAAVALGENAGRRLVVKRKVK